jgi:enoyl-CoA hydratase
MKRSDGLGDDFSTTRIGYLDVARDSAVALITMDRPEKLNAMTAEFWADLRAALDLLAADGKTRVAIITGAGERAFSSGGDIVSFTQLKSEAEMRAYQADAMAAFSHVEQCPLIVISAVNGLACGGGCELAMASDIVVAADSAAFGLPEANLGLIPGFGALRGPEVVGRQMTKFMIASGATISAQRAYEVGLVQLIVPRAELIAEARALAMKIAERSPNALAVGKKMINSTIDSRAFQYSVDEITMLQSSADRAEGVAAYLARRKPVFGSR